MNSKQSDIKGKKIVLLANGQVGMAVAKYLRNENENIIAVVLHDQGDTKQAKEIKDLCDTENVYTASQIRHQETVDTINSLRPDIAISAWFGHLLKTSFINLFPQGVINFHNSFLPYNRGKYPHVWAIYKGVPYGVSLHYIDVGIDTGDIIARRKIIIEATDTAETLYNKSLREIVKLFKETWPDIKKGTVQAVPQDDGSSHYAKEVEELDVLEMDKLKKVSDVINQLRARSFSDRSYVYFIDKSTGEKVYVKISLSKEHYF